MALFEPWTKGSLILTYNVFKFFTIDTTKLEKAV